MPDFSELDLLRSPLDPGLTVIEASAGTGKTYSISHLVPRLLLEGTLTDLSQVLLVTFTKDAARELAERVRRVLMRLAAPAEPDEKRDHPGVADLRVLLVDAAARTRLERALIDLDLLAVSTLHAFCQRTLQQEGSLCGLPVLPEVTMDDAVHLGPIVRELWIATLSADAPLAALATAQGWKLEDAQKLINQFRRCVRPRPEPAVSPFRHLRRELDVIVAKLAEPSLVGGSLALLGKVTGWNKGVADSAEAIARLRPLHAGNPAALAFWESLGFAAELPARITKRGEGKALREQAEQHPWFAAVRELVEFTSRIQWAWHQELALTAIPRLEAVMTRLRLISQDGLIGALYHALHRPGAAGAAQSARLAERLAERTRVAIIDESQDTDPRQFAIFRRIFLAAGHRRRLVLVGDPKQAIYGFRGADLATYLGARGDADAGYTLNRTHRAPPDLVEAVNRLFQRPHAFHHPGMTFLPARSALTKDRQLWRKGQPCSRLEAWVVPEDESKDYSAQARRMPALSARVASTIVDLLRHGELRTRQGDGRLEPGVPVTPRDFAVLVATNAQAEAMAEALQDRAVPVVVNSGSDVFGSDEARELHLLLGAVLDPRRTPRLRRALATRLLGLDAAALAALDTPGADGSQPGLIWQERFTRWNQIWMNRGLTALLAELDRPENGVTRRLALVPLTGERRATNYRHLTDLLLEASRDEVPRPAEVVRWLGQQMTRVEDRSQVEERQLQLASDREAVQIVTMHKAKGLEYPLVFCPYLADSLKDCPDLVQLPTVPTKNAAEVSDRLVNLQLLADDAKAEATRESLAAQLEERLRLTYVALTRAQVRGWFCSYGGTSRRDRGNPLDWLLRTDAEQKEFPAYSADWVAAAQAGRSARHAEVLEALSAPPPKDASSPPLIAWREPPGVTNERYAAAKTAKGAASVLAALPAPAVPPSWRITSFSTLTREKHAHGSLPAAPSSPETPRVKASAAPAPKFLSAPGGAVVGTAVHDWIEAWNLGPIGEAALARHLAVARLPVPREGQPAWSDALGELFEHLRLIRLPGCGSAPLHELCPEEHGSEWHFHLPLAGALSAGDLARCFAEHADAAHRPYATRLAALSEERFAGLLQGFIDRLVRHGPAWGVIDWKTNHLGPALTDYDQAGLLRCAMEEHYLLQTHLYLIALRRYLRALGLPAAPIAGAWLVFLRAIAPGESRGVLHIDPPVALLDALDELFAPAAAGARP